MQMQQGLIVKSMAGHDKENFYLVLKIVDGFAYIADGRRRKLNSPKKKNVRHLSATGQLIDVSQCLTDRALRALLHPYNFPKTKSDQI